MIISTDNYKSINSFINGWISFDNMYISSSKIIDLFFRMGGTIPTASEGRYIICENRKNKIDIQTDPMGQDLLFYYISDNYWAISNSYYSLVNYLKRKNINISLSLAACCSFFLPGSYGNQLLSNSTLSNEIRILGIDKKLSIDKKSKKIKITKNKTEYNHVNANSKKGIEIINQWLSIWLSFIKTAIDNNEVINIDISGGRDSRMVLALILASKVDLTKIRFISNPNAAEDFKIASILANELKFQLNKEQRKTQFHHIPSEKKYDLWKAGSMGVYTPVYFPSKISITSDFHFHGGGGELYRHLFTKKPKELYKFWVNYDKKHSCIENFSLLHDEFQQGIKDSNSHMNDRYGLDKHYFHFRNRLHFGRAWYKDLGKINLMPLSSRLLYSLKPMKINNSTDDDFLIALILMYGSEKLINIPFDSPNKVISETAIKQARKYIDMIKPNVEKITFYENDNDKSNESYIGKILEPQRLMKHFIEKEIKLSKTKDRYCSTFSNTSYNNALSNINNKSLSIKDSCKAAAFIISINETLME